MAVSISPLKAAIPEASVAAAASPFAGLQPGAVLAARVLALLEGGQVQLAIGNALIQAASQMPLPVGATVQLAVQNTGDVTTLQVLGEISPQTVVAQSVNPAIAASKPAAPQAVLGIPSPSAPTGLPAAVIANPDSGELVATATANAMPDSPSGIMPPVAPADAPTAVGPAMSLAAPSDLRGAVEAQRAQSPTVEPAVALRTALRTAAASQNGLSPLYAEIAAAIELPGLPEPLRSAALRMLSLRPPLDADLSAEDVKQAFTNSGLFLEARLAERTQPSTAQSTSTAAGSAPNGATSAPTEESLLPAVDLKAALAVFRQALAVALAGDEGATTNSASLLVNEVEPGAGQALTQVPTQAVPHQAPALAFPTTRPSLWGPPASTSTVPASHATQAPPPPFRGGPVTAQPPVTATIDATTPPQVAVRTLMAATDGALARQTLLQAASVPGQPSSHVDNAGPRWNFEVPFAIQQGPYTVTSVAQFEIARDGKAATQADEKGAVWRARFSVEMDPIGRVHAQIGLRGVRAAVTLWAENPEGAARLRAGAAKLSEALRAADLEAGDLVVRDGAPRARAVEVGHFLDRAS